MIGIIDYDIGNIMAVGNMLKRIGKQSLVTGDVGALREATHLILPGNGAFDACARSLRRSGLFEFLQQQIADEKKPVLGICVGAQLLGRSSEEGQEEGLSVIDMKSKRLASTSEYRVPNMGWRNVTGKSMATSFYSPSTDSKFYFTHSYYMLPSKKDHVFLEASHGIEFAAAVLDENVCGVQFHPEKSHKHGKMLLKAFAEWAHGC